MDTFYSEMDEILEKEYRDLIIEFSRNTEYPAMTVKELSKLKKLIQVPYLKNADTALIPSVEKALDRRQEYDNFRNDIMVKNTGQFMMDDYMEMEHRRQKYDPDDKGLEELIKKGVKLRSEMPIDGKSVK